MKKKSISRRGGLEVEQWSDKRTLSILVDRIPLGAINKFYTIEGGQKDVSTTLKALSKIDRNFL